MSVVIVLLCICVILLGAINRPIGYVAVGLGVLALLLDVLGTRWPR